MPKPAYIERIAGVLDVSVLRLTTDNDDEIKNISVYIASKRLGMSQEFLKQALKQKRVPFGFAVEVNENKWKYHISPGGLEKYLAAEGHDE
jgi:hypothetical protein